MELENKRVLVIGTGLSGIAAVKLLHNQKANIILFDGNEKMEKENIEAKLENYIKATIRIGKLETEDIKDLELVVISPGVPIDNELVVELKNKNIPIWGEVELAYAFSKGKIVGITGTNGKTTTTALVGEIMKKYYEEVFVVGNIGNPYTLEALNTTKDSITVAEMSSFQLETIDKFRANVSAILNITPDHLNRHHTMKNYIDAKFNITMNQTKEDYCILNYEDKVLRKRAEDIKCKVIYFSSKRKLDNGIYLLNDQIMQSEAGKSKVICNVNELKLLGTHNYENVMAGIAIALKCNVPLECIKSAIMSFEAVEHRIEYVAEKNGVKYYNDSKGTNPDAAIRGIEAMRTPTVLIGGGYDKGSEYDEWIESFKKKVTYLILIGQTKDAIAKAAKKHGFKNIIMVETLEEAVKVSASKANKGESVLLSPACASWGMFKSYEERGTIFKELVNNL